MTVNGQTSYNALIELGVPQGSDLGPLLFLIYINDLNQAIRFSRVHHSADDINLLLIDNSFKKINKHINHYLKLFTTWVTANRISLNTSKTEFLPFGPKSQRSITKHLISESVASIFHGQHKSNIKGQHKLNPHNE